MPFLDSTSMVLQHCTILKVKSIMLHNVKGMLLHGLPSEEVLRNWLASIKCEEYLRNFSDHGYDMYLVTRMTPQDLAAIGCRSPATRRKLLAEIRKLNLEDDIPEIKPPSLDKWLELLKLGEYYSRLVSEGYDTVDKVCQLTWEDLEEIGITKLGHQKRILLGIEKVNKLAKRDDELQNDCSIYDVHPNHRISLNVDNRYGTMGRVRSGLFQTRTGANLDHRGLPVAKVMPAFKHVNSALMLNNNNNNSDKPANTNGSSANATKHPDQSQLRTSSNGHAEAARNSARLVPSEQKMQNIYDVYATNGSHQETKESLNMSDLSSATLKRTPPPPPPVRTNSLKFPEEASALQQQQRYSVNGDAQQIYGSNNIYGLAGVTTNSTSFLRTPKLGTLTATTNKMLTAGGQIQTMAGQPATMRYTREAPLPPVQEAPRPVPSPMLHTNQQQQQQVNSVAYNISTTNNMVDESPIGHQLASADEFPPPPPCQ